MMVQKIIHEKYKKMYYDKLDLKDQKIVKLFGEKYNFLNSIKKAFYLIRFRQSIKDEIMCRILFIFGLL